MVLKKQKYRIYKLTFPPLAYIDSLSGPLYYNYEEMLLEILNKTKFKENYGRNKNFVLRMHNEQSNSEDDFYNSNYSGDFKRLMSSSCGHARSKLSERLMELSVGLAMVRICNPKPMKYVDLLEFLCNLTTTKIFEVLNKNPKDDIDKEIEIFYKILKKRKNIVFFIPIFFGIDEKIDEDIDVENKINYICNAIVTSQLGWIKLRFEMVQDKDTFMILPIEDYFVIIKIDIKLVPSFKIIDKIKFKEINLFCCAVLGLPKNIQIDLDFFTREI